MAQTGYTPLLTYASGTASNVPLAANLTSSASGAELALNYADGKLFYKDSGGVVQVLATKATGSIGGSTTQVQYNLSGALAGSSNLTFNGTTLTANALTTTSTVTINGGTANGVAYLNGSKVLTTGSALTFDGGMLALSGSGNIARFGDGTNTFDLRFRGSNNWSIQYAPSTDEWALQRNSVNQYSANGASHIWSFPAGEQMRLTSTGLGIGTISPAQKLVVSNAGAAGFEFDPANAIIQTYNRSSGAYIDMRQYALNIRFFTGSSPTEKMRLDSSGNLGLGVTPSVWSSGKAIEVGRVGTAFWGFDTNETYLLSNAYFNSGFKYARTGTASYYLQYAGQHQWHTAPSGTIDNSITFTQAMTLDASGRLCIGATSGTEALNIQRGAGVSGYIEVAGNNNGIGTASVLYGQDSGSNGYYWNRANAPILLGTNNQERARITSGGYFKASNTGTYGNATGSYHELRSNTTDTFIANFANTAASPYGIYLDFLSASPDNNTNYFLRCLDSTTTRCYIWSDGDLANHDGVYGTISDARLKQDIIDAGSQWDDLKAIRFRKYRMKTDVEANPNAPAMFGVVAQELAEVCPGLVDEHPNMKMVEVTDEEGNVTQTQEADGTTTMTVKSSILLMKAAKALQEAMARIETLEAKVAQLEGTQP